MGCLLIVESIFPISHFQASRYREQYLFLYSSLQNIISSLASIPDIPFTMRKYVIYLSEISSSDDINKLEIL